MQNQDIANIFHEIADILEMLEENSFRIRSYRNAAQVLGNLPRDISEIDKEGKLKEIPGIGSSIAEKIDEVLKTGTCKFHQELLKSIPHGLLDIMKIPGMGPKSAVLVYKELKVDSVEKLRKAAKAGKLASLPRMGEKLQQKVLKGAQQFNASKDKFLLSTALAYAEEITTKLKKLKEVQRLEIAGSLRRKKELIGDIDILAISKKPEKIMDVFTSLKDIKRILAKGRTKSSIVLKNNLQVDIRVVEPTSFGSALHYFTGSKEHNVAIRDLAKRKGLKINEYGIYKGKKAIGGKEEIDVFKSVGIKQYIEPELRENTGEIEAAKKNKLPKLLKLKDIKGDLHMHTKESDGKSTLEEMAKAAKALGYKYIAITEHSKAVSVAHGLDEKRLLRHIERIDKINKKIKGIKLLKGIEVDIKSDGTLDLEDEVLKRCDVVIGAIHSRFAMPKKEMTDRIIKAMQNKHMNILAHPTGGLLKEREPYDLDIEKVLKTALDLGIIMELNSYPDRLDLNDMHCKLAKKIGVKISIGTDSHHTTHLANMKYGIYTARRGWLEKKDVINTLPLKKLLKLMKRR